MIFVPWNKRIRASVTFVSLLQPFLEKSDLFLLHKGKKNHLNEELFSKYLVESSLPPNSDLLEAFCR